MTRAIATACCIIAAGAAPGCSGTNAERPGQEERLDVLVGYLSGSFSSGAQAAADPEHYLDIRLHAVSIWPWQSDGVWLYVEQAAAGALDRPYRQRVYRLGAFQGPGGVVYQSEVYTFEDPLRLAGAWRTPERFREELAREDLTLRDGCTIELTWDEDREAFVGATRGTGCASSLRGAAYATSEVELFSDRLETWDRGFDAAGEQAWGATAGPYVFDRVD